MPSIARATLSSASPYSQSRPYEVEKKERETSADYEERTWRERCHVNEQGNVFIPPMSLKNCLSEAAKYISMQIPGKGKATFTKHIEAGILCLDPIELPLRLEDVKSERLFVPSDGRRGGGSRVWKRFPIIPEWNGVATFHVFDDAVTESVFTKHLEQAGMFIGIGRFRPRNNGFYGRFNVDKIEWEEAA